jgi:hypothetical protein
LAVAITALLTGFAFSYSLACRRSAVTELDLSRLATTVLIHLAVAVVVKVVVAGLTASRQGFSLARAPASSDTTFFSSPADALSQSGGRTGVAASGSDIVYRAVAVVVNAVALFRLGEHGTLARPPLLVLTNLGARLTGANSLGVVRARITELSFTVFASAAVIDQAVAIVVKVVLADLCRLGHYLTLTGTP